MFCVYWDGHLTVCYITENRDKKITEKRDIHPDQAIDPYRREGYLF